MAGSGFIRSSILGAGSGGSSTFEDLTDTPGSLEANKPVEGNAAGDGVAFGPLFKRDATSAPTVNADTNAGYSVGSRWFDVSANKEYVCLDASAGAAVWSETTGGGGSSGALWRYLDATNLPSGAAAPEAVWQFDKSGSELNDRTANGHNLTASAAVAHAAAEGLTGLLNNDNFYLSVASPAGIRTTGAFTAEFLVSLVPGQAAHLISSLGLGVSELEADNYQFELRAGASYMCSVFFEHGAGNNESVVFNGGPVFGPVCLVTFTRSSDGLTHKLYIDGKLVDTKTAGNAPTGGGNADVFLMSSTNPGAAGFGGTMFSARITKEEWSAAQVLESYEFVRKLS